MHYPVMATNPPQKTNMPWHPETWLDIENLEPTHLPNTKDIDSPQHHKTGRSYAGSINTLRELLKDHFFRNPTASFAIDGNEVVHCYENVGIQHQQQKAA